MPANRKISQLQESTSPNAANSFVIIVDENSTNKQVRLSNLFSPGGASVLADLTDVSYPDSRQNGDVLQYDTTNSRWFNSRVVDGGHF